MGRIIKVLTVLFCLFLLGLSAQAADFFVEASTTEGNVVGDGSPGNPWQTMTYAMNQVTTGDVVNVRAGVYSVSMSGSSETFPIEVPPGVHLRLASAETVQATVEGGSAIRVFTLNADSIIEGLTIMNSGAHSSNGAVYLSGAARVLNNIIKCAGTSARGVYIPSGASGTLVSGNTIEVAASGHGVDNSVNCTITNNLIKGAGSGRGLNSSTSCTVSSNEVRGFQYGSYNYLGIGASVAISNNTLLNNTTGIYYFAGSGTPVINAKNNIICGNSLLASFTTGTIGIQGNANVTSTYNNIWNVATVYSGAVGNRTGDITLYPRFITAEGAHRIGTDSPCAAAGDGGTYQGCYAPSGVSGITSEGWVDAAGGSDAAGDGSFGSPWKTIGKGLNLTDGRLHLKAGDYNAANGESFPYTLAEDQVIDSVAVPTYLATVDAAATPRVFGLGPYATVEGMTIKTAAANSANGAVYLLARANVIGTTINCSASSAIGVYLPSTVDGSLVSGNTIEVAASGYGVEVRAAATVANNVVKGAGSGRGISIYPAFKNITVASNEVRALQYGVYAYLNSDTVRVLNNTLVNNTTGIYYFVGGGSPVLTAEGNVICGNARLADFTIGTVGIQRGAGGVFTSRYNNIWNVATVYSAAVSDRIGDITLYPRFITAEGVYKIGADSPCATGGEGGLYMGRYAPSGISDYTAEAWVDAAGGSDAAGDGSTGNPWKTIGKGLNLTDGRLHLKAGDYNAGNGESFPYTLAEDQVIDSVAVPTYLATVDAAAATPRVFGLGPYATVEGMTIKTAAANSANGAVYLLARANVIGTTINCSASSAIGVYLPSTVDGSLVSGNTIEVAASGYGAQVGAAAVIARNLFRGAGSGRGVYLYSTNKNGDVSTNEVRGFEYGIYNDLSGTVTGKVYKNTIVKNKYGIFCRLTSGSPVYDLTNNIIDGYSISGSRGIWRSNGTVNSTYNCFYRNLTTYEGTVSQKTGDIYKHPRFIDEIGDDYHLAHNSPCIISASDGSDRGCYPFTGEVGVYIKAPDGGEGLTGLSTYEITWVATKPAGGVLTVDLAYSLNSGESYVPIVSGEPNDGSYMWTVPNVTTTEAMIRVGAFGSAATDESDGKFTISSAPTPPNVVINCNDTGPGSLRAVLTYAATNAATEVIFDITTAEAGYSTGEAYPGLVTSGPDSWFRIIVNSALPAVSQGGTRIRGSTQSREAVNTAGPEVEVRGPGFSGGVDGFTINAANCTIEGLAVNRFRFGVHVNGSAGNHLWGNYIGCDATGVTNESAGTALRNTYGVFLSSGAGNNLVGGATAAERNLISGQTDNNYGIFIFGGSDHNRIKGNYIGTDRSGAAAILNHTGIYVSGSGHTTIGGVLAGERNVISGNYFGISFYQSNSNEVRGNYIGLNAAGAAGLKNGTGVAVNQSGSNIIGGSASGARNVIASNGTSVDLFNAGTERNLVSGNYIGTDQDGTSAISGNTGVYIRNSAARNIIGGTLEAERNVIAGQTFNGINISGAGSNTNEVLGNYIGTDQHGTSALGNNVGVGIHSCFGNRVGGTAPGAGNLISGNNMAVTIGYSSSNEVAGNRIGVAADGSALANSAYGFDIFGAAGEVIGPGNVIKNSGSHGVNLRDSSQRILITRNTMEANTGKGINLQAGSNSDLPYPVITAANYDGSQYTTVTGSATPDATIELFKTETTPGGDNQGEGVVYLTTVTAEGSGNWIATVEGLVNGDKVTATASLFLSPGFTSEFALNRDVYYDTAGPVVTVEAPNGGELWQGGATYEVTWSATDETGIDEIRIYYTTGEGYIQIASGEANDGSFSWLTPLVNTSQARVRVQAFDSTAEHNVGTDESDSFFTIDSAGPTAPVPVTPANGSSMRNPRPTLTWEAAGDPLSGVASYEVRLDGELITLDATTTYIPPTPLNEGLHTWEVRAKDGAGNWGAYGSSFEFTVTPAPPNVVWNCNDSGPGSLRYVLASAEAGWEIVFDITSAEAGVSTGEVYPGLVTSGGNRWFRIIVNSALPGISVEGVQVNGRTQSNEANNPLGPAVEVRGAVSQGYTGFTLTSAECTVEGLVINRFVNGILIDGPAAQRNRIIGNYIGCDATGTQNQVSGTMLYNDVAVAVNSGASFNIIGGSLEAERNIISGNHFGLTSGIGVSIQGSGTNSNEVKGNYIGTDRTGTASLANHRGISIYNDACYNVVGGDLVGERNVISGNLYFEIMSRGTGVSLDSDHNLVRGNYIGIAADGNTALSNKEGIYVGNEAADCVIGGSIEAHRNVISGNSSFGVWIADLNQRIVVIGNYIGTDAGGSSAVGNQYGVGITGASSHNRIGGGLPGEGNLISGNSLVGVLISNAGTNSNEVSGNLIGPNKDGNAGLPNAIVGVGIIVGAHNRIGGPTAGHGNLIGWNSSGAYGGVVIQASSNEVGPHNRIINNNGFGVLVMAGINDVLITRNSMEANTGKGISLEAGANSNIAHPVIGSAGYDGVQYTTVSGTAPASATIELFKTETTPEAQGEGAVYLGMVTAEASGNWAATLQGVVDGDQVTATASLFSSPGHTSEFALNRTVGSSPIVPTVGSIVLRDRLTGSRSYTGDRIISLEALGVSGGPTEMIVSESAVFSGATWEAYLNPATFELSAADGTKEVRYKIRNAALTESATVSASIILDTTPPGAPLLLLPPDGSTTNEARPLFSWQPAVDAWSGIAGYDVRVDNVPATQDATTTYIPPAELADGPHTWEVRAKDGAGNWGAYSAPFSFTVDTIDPDKTPPVISIRINGSAVKDGDHIPARPRIVAVVTDEVGPISATIYLDGVARPTVIDLLSPTKLEASYQVTDDLAGEEVQKHVIRVEAADQAGNVGSREVGELKVSYGSARLVGQPVTSRSVLKPGSGETMLIAYHLNRDVEVNILMVGIAGEVVWNRRFLSGRMGGRAGYNELSFNGISDLSGRPLGNGIYVYRIIAEGKAIGKGHVVIYE